MSLINDALKQARQSQQPNQPPSGQQPLRPVELEPRRAADWLLPLSVIALAGVAAYFIGLALARHKPSTSAKAPVISVKQPAIAAVATNSPPASNSLAAIVPAVSEMKLQGVVSGAKSWAIVDGKTVFVGDSVGGFRVKEIAPNSITLESPDGSLQKLGLGGQ
jgi:hypothetical protein